MTLDIKVFTPDAPLKFTSQHKVFDREFRIDYSIPNLLLHTKVPNFAEAERREKQALRCIFLIIQRLDRASRSNHSFVAAAKSPADNSGVKSLKAFSEIGNLKFLIDSISEGGLSKLASYAHGVTGELRTEFTWVDGKTPSEAWLVPPPRSAVRELLQDLESFLTINISHGCPTYLAQVFFYQFIQIHPLRDGNGRVARLWLCLFSAATNSLGGFALTMMSLRNRRSLAIVRSEKDQSIFSTNILASREHVEDIYLKVSELIDKVLDSPRLKAAFVAYCASGWTCPAAIKYELACSDSLLRKNLAALSEDSTEGQKLKFAISEVEEKVIKFTTRSFR